MSEQYRGYALSLRADRYGYSVQVTRDKSTFTSGIGRDRDQAIQNAMRKVDGIERQKDVANRFLTMALR